MAWIAAFDSLRALDYSTRVALFLLAHLLLYLWTRFVVAPATPGASRLLRSLPSLSFLLFPTFLFHTDRAEEFILALYVVHAFFWTTITRIVALCANRGQLVKSLASGSDVAFALSLLSPTVVHFKETPLSSQKHREHNCFAYSDVTFSVVRFTWKELASEIVHTVGRLVTKLGLMVSMREGYLRAADSDHLFWRDFCFSWFLYGLTSSIEDVSGLSMSMMTNIKMTANFDCPWKATSFGEFWSKRYNIVVSQALKDFLYDPICEGVWIHGQKYYGKQKPSALRRIAAILAVFGTSGFLHIVAIMQVLHIGLPPRYGLFFVLNGIVVVAEGFVRRFVRQQGFESLARRIPSWLFSLYTLGLIFYLAHHYFWPDLVKVDYPEQLVNAALYLVKLP